MIINNKKIKKGDIFRIEYDLGISDQFIFNLNNGFRFGKNDDYHKIFKRKQHLSEIFDGSKKKNWDYTQKEIDNYKDYLHHFVYIGKGNIEEKTLFLENKIYYSDGDIKTCQNCKSKMYLIEKHYSDCNPWENVYTFAPLIWPDFIEVRIKNFYNCFNCGKIENEYEIKNYTPTNKTIKQLLIQNNKVEYQAIKHGIDTALKNYGKRN